MQIKILDSWLREHLKTKAKPQDIAKILSLTSVSVEKLEPARNASASVAGGKLNDDYIYDIEVTTNRVDLMSVLGIAKEASAAMSEHGIPSEFIPLNIAGKTANNGKFPILIKNDPEIVNRVCAVVLEVTAKQSPKIFQERLEASGIRSLNNLIDITNYVMREVGHPTHVFDFDKLNTKSLTIRQAQKGESIKTLDEKTHTLLGGDIVAENDKGEIVDLLGVMGTANSVVSKQTKKILFFIDNNNPKNIRNTSMSLAIRTEAAVINEKGVDPNLAMDALLRGVELYEKYAEGKVVSSILDIYPNPPKSKTIEVSLQKINDVLGVEVSGEKSRQILEKLGFDVEKNDESLSVKIPSSRLSDMNLPEDVIEEIARVYGYEKLPSTLPNFSADKPYKFANDFYFEQRLKNAMKYIGFTEIFSYSMVSEELYEGPIENAVKIKNPLTSDMVFMRTSIVPSLLSAVSENKRKKEIKIFEIANVYIKRSEDLPKELLSFAGVVRSKNTTFYHIKGLIEAIFSDLGITELKFKEKDEGTGASIYKGSENLGYIEAYDNETFDFEFDFEKISALANLKKSYKPLLKFPPVIEDIAFEINEGARTEDIVEEIKKQSPLITEVSMLDEYGSSKTFHVIYQDPEKNLTLEETSKIREKIVKAILQKYATKVK